MIGPINRNASRETPPGIPPDGILTYQARYTVRVSLQLRGCESKHLVAFEPRTHFMVAKTTLFENFIGATARLD